MKEPTVGVVVAARNAELTIGAALQTVLSQTVPPSQIVVISDGSIDRTAEIAEATLRLHSASLVVELPQSIGRAAARNLAVGQLSTDFVAVCDADDMSFDNRFHELQRLAQLEGADVVSGQALVVTSRGFAYDLTMMPTEHAEIVRQLEEGLMSVIHPACIIRRQSFVDAGAYTTALLRAQDLDLMIRLSRLGCRFVSSSKPLIAYQYPVLIGRQRLAEQRSYADMARQLNGIGYPPGSRTWAETNLRGVLRASLNRSVRLEKRRRIAHYARLLESQCQTL